MAHDVYDNPLITRYASRDMAAIFGDQQRYGTWRQLWIALAESQRELGLPVIIIDRPALPPRRLAFSVAEVMGWLHGDDRGTDRGV